MTNYQSYEEAIKAGAKGTDTITEPCDRCSGNGDIGYGKVKVYDVRVGAGVAQTCWKCFGNKTQTVRVSSVKARIRRAEKRAEEAARKQWREGFDLATARAVARLDKLAEYCLPLVRVGGLFIAMKAESAAEELAEAQGAIARLGGRVRDVRTAALPGGDARSLIFVEKISHTPPQYPRNGGKIAKSPLR